MNHRGRGDRAADGGAGAPAAGRVTSPMGLLEGEEEADDDGEEGRTLHQRREDNRVALDVAGGVGLTSNGLTGLAANHADADAGANDGEASADGAEGIRGVFGTSKLEGLLEGLFRQGFSGLKEKFEHLFGSLGSGN
jgi:hypothetical protein